VLAALTVLLMFAACASDDDVAQTGSRSAIPASGSGSGATVSAASDKLSTDWDPATHGVPATEIPPELHAVEPTGDFYKVETPAGPVFVKRSDLPPLAMAEQCSVIVVFKVLQPDFSGTTYCPARS
jgi:hypothetical protein